MIGFIRKLIKDRRGNALAIACAAMPLVVGAAGLAMDTIQWTLVEAATATRGRFCGDRWRLRPLDRDRGDNHPTATVDHDVQLNLHTWMALKTGYPQFLPIRRIRRHEVSGEGHPGGSAVAAVQFAFCQHRADCHCQCDGGQHSGRWRCVHAGAARPALAKRA